MSSVARRKVGARKLRLFAFACVRRVWHLLPSAGFREAVEVAERHADGLATGEQLQAAVRAAYQGRHRPRDLAAWAAYDAMCRLDGGRLPVLRDITRCALWAAVHGEMGAAELTHEQVSGSGPFRAAERAAQAHLVRDILGNLFRPAPVDPAWSWWNGGTIPQLARAIYEERAFDRLPILADALEAGGADPDLLGHLRGPDPHVRGCWALDLILGKS